MMSVRLIKTGRGHSEFYNKTEPFFVYVNSLYSRALNRFIKHPKFALVGLGVSALIILLLFVIIPDELAPLEDRSRINVSATAPEGATFEYMEEAMDRVAKAIVEEIPELEVLNTMTSSGATNKGSGYILLHHPSDRNRHQEQIYRGLTNKLSKMPEAQVYASQPQSLSSESSGLPVQFVIQAGSHNALREVLPLFLEKVQLDPVFAFADVNLKFNRPELRVEIDRNRAANLGVSTRDIAQTLQLVYAGSRYGYFELDGRRYWVMGQVPYEDRREPFDLKSLHVRNNRGELVQLDNLVSVIEDSGPPQLFRFNRMVSATVSASLAPGKTIGDGVEKMRSIAKEVLDDRFSTELAGASRDFQESSSSLYFIFLIALVFIYLVLAAQFECLKSPLVILLTVPLALFGALLFLWYFNITLNVFSKIGMIMLIGLVTKNAILIVEFFRQKLNLGIPKFDAIQEAASTRFRPILMTTFSTILGTLPLVLTSGAGSAARTSMGVAVIGGLIIGTFFTLFIIPAILSFVPFKKKDKIV
jgi:multidrug efflux pump